jgi:circadian clock protein KaiC
MEETQVFALEKTKTGIQGLDEILGGGLPCGRTTLVCGGPGCGKTLLASEFLVRGAEEYGEPGVFMAFEETSEELSKNVASLGIDLHALIEQGKIFVDYVYIERSEIEETGEYNLEGLFIRLASAIAAIGAKRVVLDTIETIFAGFANESILRSEIRRLFRWMKDQGVTAIVTGERGEKSLTRYGLEEYVSDCVILLENRVDNKIANRILRIVKYRGSSHGTDEYPFLIGDDGLWVQPVTSLGLNYEVSDERISTGVSELDNMLGGKGYYRSSSILVSGAAGTGKTSLAISLTNSACQNGECCLYFAFEEAASQINRNMESIGFNLIPWVQQGLLQIHATRPTFHGIEMHLLTMQKLINEVKPSVVIIDPLSNLISIGSPLEVKSMLVRLIDFLKSRQITTLFTSLTSSAPDDISSEAGVSSLMDIWISLRNLETNGERNRTLYVLKARGMEHSSQVREFILTPHGIELMDVMLDERGVVIGSARATQRAQERAAARKRQADQERRQRELARKRKVIESQIMALQAEIEAEEEQLAFDLSQEGTYQNLQVDEKQARAQSRQGSARS